MGDRRKAGRKRNKPRKPLLILDDLALDAENERRARRRGEEEQSAYLRRLER